MVWVWGTAVPKKSPYGMGIAVWEKWAKSKGEIAERRRNMTRRQPHDRAYDREESDNIFTQIYGRL